ncbi:MAG TPA: universal stress protein [Ktedonobacteraceae bacterium]|nr:universal stress protein [Ktedonobacteraceae bacterium]
MFKRILVPLDGSTRAEKALPIAARLARASQSQIVLIQVVRPMNDYYYGPYVLESTINELDRTIDANLAEAKRYLEGIASTLLQGIETIITTDAGPVAERIFAAIQSFDIDLVVINSHGYTGFKRWVLGSVAEKVARHAMVPVLILREHGTSSELHPYNEASMRILVPLDGSLTAKAALGPAANLAAALSAPNKGALHLVRIVPLVAVRGGIVTLEPDTKEHLMHKAKIYLTSVSTHLREGIADELGLTVTWSVALDTDIASALIEKAENGEDAAGTGAFGGCDFIAMSTHGREGLQRWAMGSVTSRVLHATKLPMLIVQPEKEKTI